MAWELLATFSRPNNFPHIRIILTLTYSSFFQDAKISYQGIGNNGFSTHVWETFRYYTCGLLIGLIWGVVSSIFLYFHEKLRAVSEPIFEFVRIVPPLILAPFLLIIFKDNPVAKLFIVIFYTSLSLNIYCLNALDHVNRNYVHLANLFRLSKFKFVKDILMPSILPAILGGLRINIAMSLGVLIVSEAIGSFYGIGKILAVIQQFNDAAYIFVCIFWAVVIVLFFDLLLMIIVKKKMFWVS